MHHETTTTPVPPPLPAFLPFRTKSKGRRASVESTGLDSRKRKARRERANRGRKGWNRTRDGSPVIFAGGKSGEVGRGKFPIKGNPTLGAGRARVRRPNNKAITIDDARTAIIRVYRHPRKRGYVTVWPMQLHPHPTLPRMLCYTSCPRLSPFFRYHLSLSIYLSIYLSIGVGTPVRRRHIHIFLLWIFKLELVTRVFLI